MGRKFDIGIKSGRNNANDFAPYFRKHRYREDGTARWVKDRCSRKEVREAMSFASRCGLKFFYNNEYGERSTTYRYEYFRNHPPVKNGKYQCVYCGKYFTKQDITVDHMFPVAKASKSIKLQKKLKRAGISGLNDQANLVAACAKCNQKKSASMGLWIFRARIGRHHGLWCVRKFFRLVLVLACLYLVACLFIPEICLPFLQGISIFRDVRNLF